MSSILALDIGEKRIGVALAEASPYFAKPLTTIKTAELNQKINQLIQEYNVRIVVVGFPRNQAGEATDQSKFAEEIISKLEPPTTVKIAWQDESLTSVKAEAELKESGKPYNKEAVDALAATYILDDYIKEHVS